MLIAGLGLLTPWDCCFFMAATWAMSICCLTMSEFDLVWATIGLNC